MQESPLFRGLTHVALSPTPSDLAGLAIYGTAPSLVSLALLGPDAHLTYVTTYSAPMFTQLQHLTISTAAFVPVQHFEGLDYFITRLGCSLRTLDISLPPFVANVGSVIERGMEMVSRAVAKLEVLRLPRQEGLEAWEGETMADVEAALDGLAQVAEGKGIRVEWV